MLSDSDNSPVKKKKVKSRNLVTSSSSDDDSDVPVRKRKSRPRLSSSSDSDGSCVIKRTHKKLRVLSESDSETSSSSSTDSEVDEAFRPWTSKNRRSKARALQTDSDNSEDFTTRNPEKAESGSQSSDSDESEKCIICFKAFRGVIAHPSGCSHNFHSECLLTWSQTSNTCPIDRIKYTQIVVKRSSDGSVVKRQEVSTPPPQDLGNDIEPDDPTFCEVCNQHDREHEMLLCDRCEAGYHLNCLTPPLIEVPVGDWFCPDCAALDNAEIDDDEINELLRDGTILSNRMRQRTSAPPRIGPRTRAVQRVINSIRQMAEQSEQYLPSSSTSRSNTRRTQRRKRTHRRSTHYKVELITVEDGTTIEVKVAVNTRRRRKKKRKSNASCGRGRMSSSKRSSVKYESSDNHRSTTNERSFQRLDIFGSRPQLEYFSGCEAEDELDEEGGLGLMRARPATVGVRGMANRKQMAAQILRSTPRRPPPRIAVSSAPPDLVSSILDEQTKWHSPNAIIHSNSKGEVKAVLPNKTSNLPVKRSAGNGEGASSSSGDVRSTSSPRESESQRNGESSTSVPPLQPPPQPVFSRVYEDEDFDLYADIEPPLAPPPEPPALLLALEGDEAASSPEDAMLVIDDRQTYDPDVPTSPPPSPEKPNDEKKESESSTKPAEKVLDLPSVDLASIRLPSPEPDIDDCPNRVMYSAASVNIARQTKSDSDSEKDIEICKPAALLNRMSLDPSKKIESDVTDVPLNDAIDKEKQDADIDEATGNLSKVKIDDQKKIGEEKPVEVSEKYDPDLSDDDDQDQNVVSSEGPNEDAKLENMKDISNEKESTENQIKKESDIVEEKTANKEELEDKPLDAKSEEEGESNLKLKEEEEEHKLKNEEENNIKEEEKDKVKEEVTEMKNEDESLKEGNEKELKLEEENEDEGLIKSTLEEVNSKEGSPLLISKENDEDLEEKEKLITKSPINTDTNLNSSDEKAREPGSSPESTPPRKRNGDKDDQEGEDVLELGCGDDERDGLVDITDEEISTYEKSWELEDNQASTEKTAGLEGLDTEAISDCEYNLAEDGQPVPKVSIENGPKEEGEIISDEKRVPVAWKKITKAKERSYREKDTSKEKSKKKEKKPREKRKELERYDVRKIISDKPKKRRVDEFGRDISPSRSRSISDSRSRSKSIRSRRSRSRSRSKKKRSRERRSRNRSRGRSRGRSRSIGRNRVRSRDRSKRRGRSLSRSRSDSRRRRSRTPRKNKERRSRAKSREKKRRKRDSSISCSSCSCSSCERERRKSKKLTVIVPNKPANSGKDKKKSKYKDRGELKRRRVDSPVPSKEVFTSGDNILVSVNFKSSKSGEVGRKENSKKKKDDESKKKKDKSSKENQPLRSIVSKSSSNQQSQRRRINARNLKPVAIIDLAQSPFREQTLSPKEVIVLTDSDSDDKRKNDESNLPPCQVTGPKTPPEPHIKFNIISSKPQMLRSLANPLLDSVDQMEGEGEEEDERVELPHKGPNTPPEPPVPYDPFEPTKSRSPTPLQELEESINPPTSPGDKILPPEPTQRPTSPPKPPPETPKTPSPLHSPPPKPQEDNPPEKAPLSPPNNCNDDSMDMGGGGDSPYSPGSSDGEDLFEPLPQITTPAPLPKIKPRTAQKHVQKLTPSPLKRKPGNKTSTPLKNSKGKKESVGLKLDEDQLKILDDLPNSAVEMQVKDKFLKKLNRQERVVEEVKMVLKPHYAKKHVNKEEYKEILRKSVPKICHSRSGEINPMKIQRLIEAYVKKYRHLRRKRKMTNFSAPDSIPLLKPKPKATMWC